MRPAGTTPEPAVPAGHPPSKAAGARTAEDPPDALSYGKAVRAIDVPASLEVSRSGTGEPTTVRRLVATLSNALGDAVRQRRLRHNPARHAPLPRAPKPNLPCRTSADAVTFLRHCATVDDPLTDLFEILIGTGLRKGEALALHWADVHLDQAVLFVRYTPSNIRNTTPVMTAPKTESSHAWVGLSDRVIAAFQRQAAKQARLGLASPTALRCGPRRSCVSSTGSARTPASHGSASMTSAASPPP